MAVSMVGMGMGGVLTPIGGMGTAILGTVLGTVAVAENRRAAEQPLWALGDRRLSSFSTRSVGVGIIGGLPVERHAGPGRGNMPPPIC